MTTKIQKVLYQGRVMYFIELGRDENKGKAFIGNTDEDGQFKGIWVPQEEVIIKEDGLLL